MTRQDFYNALRRLNLNQLVAFLVVAELKSFRGAATRMSLTQSAVSVQIRNLEEALGLPLFHRTTRSVGLTPAGETLLSTTRSLCWDVIQIANQFREEAQLQRGLVTVVSMPSPAVTLMPGLMRQYQELHPGVEIRLIDVESKVAIDTLLNGDADIGILSQAAGMAAFDFVPVWEDEFVLVTLKKPSDAASANRRVSIGEAARLPLLTSPTGLQLRTLVDQMFAQANCMPRVVQNCLRPQTLLSLVEEGFGAAVTTLCSIAPLDTSRVTVRRFSPKAKRDIGVATVRAKAQAPLVASFRRFIEVQGAHMSFAIGGRSGHSGRGGRPARQEK